MKVMQFTFARMLKQRVGLWFIISACLLFNSAIAKDTNSQQGLLWKISQPGVAPSYLLGTMHTEDPRVINLPELIQKRFDEADSASFEIMMDMSTLLKSAAAMFLAEGQTLDKLLSAKDYNYIMNALEAYGMPEEAAKIMKPWAIILTVSMPKNETGEFLDLILYQQAKFSGKRVYGLEKIEEQLSILDSLSIEEQTILLKDTLSYLDKMPHLLDTMHELYLNRDLTKLMQFSEEYMTNDDPNVQKLLNKFMNLLVNIRNQTMLERMQPRLREGNAFIAVGALHLPGEQGLLKLLQKQGYRISPEY